MSWGDTYITGKPTTKAPLAKVPAGAPRPTLETLRYAGGIPTIASRAVATPAYKAIHGAGIPFNAASVAAFKGAAGGTQTSPYQPSLSNKGGSGSSGGSRGGGGGGGGGGGAAGMSQANVDWLTQLLARSKPGQAVAGPALDLPNTPFDDSLYRDLETRLGEAIGQSRAGADTAYSNLGNYLTSNYKNAFAQGPPQQQAPGMDQAAMQRMMQAQNVNPALASQQQEGQAAGNAAFSNLWSLLGANEETAQRNRLNRVQTDRGTTNMAIDAANLGGMTGIGMQRGQAKTAWQQQQDQIAQQEAMANWQRQNEVADTNLTNNNSWTNAQMQALLGMIPSFGTALPNLDTLLAGR